MTGTVVYLSSHRRNPEPSCYCDADFTCYPHRLLGLLERIDAVAADVEQFRFCDMGTFTRVHVDVRDVVRSITDDVMPAGDERELR